MIGDVAGVAGVAAGLASFGGDAEFKVRFRKARRKVQKEQFVWHGAVVGVLEAGVGPTARTLKGPSRARLQNGCVGALSDTLADSGDGVVDPGPAANGERRRCEKGSHDGCVAAL